jgi:hypothetical protein
MIENMLITEKITNESTGAFFKTGGIEKEFCSPSIGLKMPENWKLDKSVSGLAYMKFQRIIHDYIDGIEATAALNEEILKRLGQR